LPLAAQPGQARLPIAHPEHPLNSARSQLVDQRQDTGHRRPEPSQLTGQLLQGLPLVGGQGTPFPALELLRVEPEIVLNAGVAVALAGNRCVVQHVRPRARLLQEPPHTLRFHQFAGQSGGDHRQPVDWLPLWGLVHGVLLSATTGSVQSARRHHCHQCLAGTSSCAGKLRNCSTCASRLREAGLSEGMVAAPAQDGTGASAA